MGIRLFQVDAFTDKAFAGNPAAVCFLSEARDDQWMAQVAREMNLSETAFLRPVDDGFSLRWFTPAVEVDLCGHATLASAHLLWETGTLEADQVARFHTRSGLLTAERRGDLIEMDFPALDQAPATAPAELLVAMGIDEAKYVGRFGAPYLIELESEEAVRKLAPDFSALRQMPGRGVLVTSLASAAEYQVVSRYFAPWVGVDEDPVTGSVHCCLAPFWGQRLGLDEFKAYQASARGGLVHLRLAGERVKLGGRAVAVFSGELLV